jgi:Glutaminase
MVRRQQRARAGLQPSGDGLSSRYRRLSECRAGEWADTLYDQDSQRNLDAAREVALNLRRAGMSPYEADSFAILGGLLATIGGSLRQAAAHAAATGHSPGAATLRAAALVSGRTTLGKQIRGSWVTVEEVYARMAAFGDPTSSEPIAFHATRMFCPSRAHLLVEQLSQLGLAVQKTWAISPDPMMNNRANDSLQLRPVRRDGSPLMDAQGQVIWPAHVAPVVEVPGPHGTTEVRVIDPSLLREPATLDEWNARVDPRCGHSQQVTPVGVAPVDPSTGARFPGKGFHASTYPEPGNPTQFAQGRMITAFQQTPFQGLPWFDPTF